MEKKGLKKLKRKRMLKRRLKHHRTKEKCDHPKKIITLAPKAIWQENDFKQLQEFAKIKVTWWQKLLKALRIIK